MERKAFRHARVDRFDAMAQEYGDEFLRLVDGLHRADPAADRVVDVIGEWPRADAWEVISEALKGEYRRAPEALRDLVESAAEEPQWVDWSRLERGAAVLLRTGLLGGLVLGAKCLVEGYCAPAGNKPLVFSGRLQERAAMRLNETARFVQAVASPGGMRPGGEGFDITLRVRLMHAQVRRLIQQCGRWREDLWALPINQHDMVATIHLFSTAFLKGLSTLGWATTELEQEDFLHLWRYVGHVIGVEEALLPRAMREAERQWEMIQATQGQPDEDSRALTRALLEGPLNMAQTEEERTGALKHVAFAKGMSRVLLGKEMADALGLPDNRWSRAAPLIAGSIRSAQRLRRWRAVEQWLEGQGGRYWELTVIPGADGTPLRFDLPAILSGRL